MRNLERLIWIGAVLLSLSLAWWSQLDQHAPEPDAPASQRETIAARCGVAAGGALSSSEVAITCGLDKAGVEAVIARAIGEFDLNELVKQVQQGDPDPPAAVDRMAFRLGLTRETVIDLLDRQAAAEPGKEITPASLARELTRGETRLVVNVISAVAKEPSDDTGAEISAATGSSGEEAPVLRGSLEPGEAKQVSEAPETIVEESRKLQVDCGVVAGDGVDVGITRITCGPEKEDIDAIIERLVAEARIDELIEDLRQGTLARPGLLDVFQKDLNLSRTTALTLLKQIADSGTEPDQAADRLQALTRQHVKLTYQLGLLPADDPDAMRLRDLAAVAIGAGQYETAAALLQQRSEIQDTRDMLSAAQQEVAALRHELDTLVEKQQETPGEKTAAQEEPAKPTTGKDPSPDIATSDTEGTPPLSVSQDRVVLNSPSDVSAGSLITFQWQGPAAPDDLIFIAAIDQAENMYPASNRQRHEAESGSPATLTAPADPGTYEIRYLSYANAKPLARVPLEVTAPKVEFNAPQTVVAGSVVSFGWSGPNAPNDLLFFAEPALEKTKYFSSDRRRHTTQGGSPATLVAPAREGNHEIRYYSYNNGTVLFARSLEVTPPEVTFEAPDTVNPGAHLRFNWEGPNAPGDMIFIARRDLAENQYFLSGQHRHLARDGRTAELVAPADPGEYEIRYFSYANGSVLSATPLTVK